MIKAMLWLDIKLRFYCFILRLELEIICKNDSEKLWRTVYGRVTDPLKPFRPTMCDIYRVTHRKFVKNTIDWIDYFTKLYQQKYEDADWKIAEN